MDLQDFARIGANFFTSAKYENGDTFIKLKDDAPNWIKDAVYVAHDDMMPDDRIYDVACQAFHFIAESDDDEPDSASSPTPRWTSTRDDSRHGWRLTWPACLSWMRPAMSSAMGKTSRA